jgi:hypothetical protein
MGVDYHVCVCCGSPCCAYDADGNNSNYYICIQDIPCNECRKYLKKNGVDIKSINFFKIDLDNGFHCYSCTNDSVQKGNIIFNKYYLNNKYECLDSLFAYFDHSDDIEEIKKKLKDGYEIEECSDEKKIKKMCDKYSNTKNSKYSKYPKKIYFINLDMDEEFNFYESFQNDD